MRQLHLPVFAIPWINQDCQKRKWNKSFININSQMISDCALAAGHIIIDGRI